MNKVNIRAYKFKYYNNTDRLTHIDDNLEKTTNVICMTQKDFGINRFWIWTDA